IGSTRNGTYPAAASYSSIINENGGSGIRITPFNNTRLTITGDLAITNNSKFFKTSTNGVKYLGAGIERASNAEVPLSFGTTNLTIGSTEFCWAYNMPLTLAATSTTGYGMLLQHTITASAISQTAYGLYLNQTFSTAHTGTIFSRLKLAAGSATVAPLEWTSGAVLTTARAGVMEFLTDSWYGTTTTGAIRRMFVAGNTGRVTGQTAANTSVATYTLNNVADATYEVSANVLVTTSSAEFFTVTCTYTDEGNTSRTVTLNFSLVAGTIGTTIAAANGAVPYQGVPLHIRCIKNTTITIKTTGTFTGCTYNVEGVIKQTA
ncbi:MAG: hypothetical protein NTV32_09840, partial [Gammaproteobacteria bacterium]|nr:hypothetical protein [Gammaproteobacteria bacterium]